MTTWTHFHDWTARDAEVMVRGATPPDPTKYRLALLNGITATANMSKAAIASAELLQANGYNRGSNAYTPGQGARNATKNRYELPVVTIDITASGGSLQWSTAVLWADSDAGNSKAIESIDTAADRLTLTAHGLSNGANVAVTSDDTLPGGIVADTLYYVKSIDSNTVELYSDSGLTTIVDTTSAGAGTHHLRLCNGTPVFFANFPSQDIGDGATQPIEINWAFINCGNINGV